MSIEKSIVSVAAAQGIEFLRSLQSAVLRERLLPLVRSVAPAMMEDRRLAPDMTTMQGMVLAGGVGNVVEDAVPALRALCLA